MIPGRWKLEKHGRGMSRATNYAEELRHNTCFSEFSAEAEGDQYVFPRQGRGS
jgi:hypothetical protein